MARGLASMFGSVPRGKPREAGGDTGERLVSRVGAHPVRPSYDGSPVAPTKYFARGGYAVAGGGSARYAGRPASPTKYFAKGGEMEDPDDEVGEVSPELKLAAYELLECLNGSNYGPGSDRGGKAEALARHLLAFFHLAEEMPHEEGPHKGESEGESEGYEPEE